MHHGHDDHMGEPRECGRCTTPMTKGHGMVCALHWVAEASFYAAVVLLVMFWGFLLYALTTFFRGFEESAFGLTPMILLAAMNSGLLFMLSLTCGMRAKWLRHRIVQDMDDYLDADGSCCGGSCAGSCGDGGCGEEGCSPDGCDDPDCCKKTDDVCGYADEGSEEQGGCCGGGCCK